MEVLRPQSGADHFRTTQWSVVLAAVDRAAPGAEDALAQLYAAYWRPLFGFVRRQGYDFAAAQDLTQEFFAALLEKDFLKNIAPDNGRFRSFLLAALKHFLANRRRAAQTLKRGGGRTILPLVLDEGSTAEPAHGLTAEQVFDYQWAVTLLDRVLDAVRQEFAQAGRLSQFEAYRPYLAGDDDAPSYRDAARHLGTSEAAVKTAVHRLRRRFGQLLRDEITPTVGAPADVDEEIRDLFDAVRL